jgi:hypothetical protein
MYEEELVNPRTTESVREVPRAAEPVREVVTSLMRRLLKITMYQKFKNLLI